MTSNSQQQTLIYYAQGDSDVNTFHGYRQLVFAAILWAKLKKNVCYYDITLSVS